jgi:hypothetical protein
MSMAVDDWGQDQTRLDGHRRVSTMISPNLHYFRTFFLTYSTRVPEIRHIECGDLADPLSNPGPGFRNPHVDGCRRPGARSNTHRRASTGIDGYRESSNLAPPSTMAGDRLDGLDIIKSLAKIYTGHLGRLYGSDGPNLPSSILASMVLCEKSGTVKQQVGPNTR